MDASAGAILLAGDSELHLAGSTTFREYVAEAGGTGTNRVRMSRQLACRVLRPFM